MKKKDYKKQIKEFKEDGWIHIDDQLPIDDGVYETIIHQGSIQISFSIPTKKLFRNGKFPRMDWNYVIFWRKDKMKNLRQELGKQLRDSINVSQIVKNMPNMDEIGYYSYDEAKIAFMEDMLCIIDENTEEEKEKNILYSEIYNHLNLFESSEDSGPNTADDDSYKKNTIYKITGELGEDLYLAYNKETSYLNYILFSVDIKNIKTRKDLNKSFARSIHSNDIGKEMEFVKKIKK